MSNCQSHMSEMALLNLIECYILALQVGVNILMAQVGSFVPCHKASISVRDCIFARVGAGDCQVSALAYYLEAQTLELIKFSVRDCISVHEFSMLFPFCRQPSLS